MHRNLYTVGHRTDIGDNSCRACTVPENQLHLGTCDGICEEFWTPLIQRRSRVVPVAFRLYRDG